MFLNLKTKEVQVFINRGLLLNKLIMKSLALYLAEICNNHDQRRPLHFKRTPHQHL